MTSKVQGRFGNSRQRSFWLRCFLGPIPILFALLLCASANAHADVCVSQTFHVARVHGHVSDQNGEKIPNVEIALKKAGKIVLEGTTDDAGDFHLKASPGKYDLEVRARGFEPGWAPLMVGPGPKTWFRSNTLYVTLEVGSFKCLPNVTTSYKEFKNQIRVPEPGFGEQK